MAGSKINGAVADICQNLAPASGPATALLATLIFNNQSNEEFQKKNVSILIMGGWSFGFREGFLKFRNPPKAEKSKGFYAKARI
jgi:hypothetical protein